MGLTMKAILSRTRSRDTVSITGATAESTKANGRLARWKGKVSFGGQMGAITKVAKHIYQ
jgi:hypothetical protein